MRTSIRFFPNKRGTLAASQVVGKSLPSRECDFADQNKNGDIAKPLAGNIWQSPVLLGDILLAPIDAV